MKINSNSWKCFAYTFNQPKTHSSTWMFEIFGCQISLNGWKINLAVFNPNIWTFYYNDFNEELNIIRIIDEYNNIILMSLKLLQTGCRHQWKKRNKLFFTFRMKKLVYKQNWSLNLVWINVFFFLIQSSKNIFSTKIRKNTFKIQIF